MAWVKTCSNAETNATTGLVGFFYPKNIYNMLGLHQKNPHIYAKTKTAYNGNIGICQIWHVPNLG